MVIFSLVVIFKEDSDFKDSVKEESGVLNVLFSVKEAKERKEDLPRCREETENSVLIEDCIEIIYEIF